MHLAASLVALVAATSLLASCAEEARRVDVQPVPAPARVGFVILDPTLFYGLSVETCRSHKARWVLENVDLKAPPRVISYGVAPPGFATRTGPVPLGPGCYLVTVTGPSTRRFHIGADGALVVDSAGRTASSPDSRD